MRFKGKMQNKALVKEILLKENITTWYQPVIDTQKNQVLGWEGLTRGPSVTPLHSADALFKAAQEADKLKPVELMCLKNAVNSFEQLVLQGKLFVNVSHELFLAGNHLRKQLIELSKNSPIPADRVVIELTQQSATSDIDKLVEAAKFFHSLGVEIAIDDLGVGQISHADWMKLEPEYVKVSRQFINNIEKDQEKIDTVKSIVSAASKAKAKVIALGVETKDELEQVSSLGISLCEGYLFQRPLLSPNPSEIENMDVVLSKDTDRVLARNLTESRELFELSTSLSTVMAFFEQHPLSNSVAVVLKSKDLGIFSRSSFYEGLNKLDISGSSSLESLESYILSDVTVVDASTTLLELSKQIVERSPNHMYDDFIVSKEAKYLGIASVIEVMRQLVAKQS